MDESQLVEKHIGLVGYIVKRMSNLLEDYHTHFSKDDIYQEGCIGLLQAIRTYQSDKGYAFSTYAGRCITNAILMFFRKENKYPILLALDKPIPFWEESERYTYKDMVEEPVHVEDEILAMALKEFYENENHKKQIKKRQSQAEERQRQVFGLLIEGYKQTEMVPLLGWSQRVIAGDCAEIRKHINRLWLDK
jgi:RNA polymerase sporulation-specific sigma factor